MSISRRGVMTLAGALALAGEASAAEQAFSFPIRVTRNQPWTAVFVNKSTTPLVFLVDTGASGFGISDKAAADCGLTLVDRAKVQGAVGRRDVAIYHAREVVIANALREREVYMAAVVRDSADTVSGIIPTPRNGVLSVDFEAQTITLSGHKVPDVKDWPVLSYASTGASEVSGSLDRMGERSRDEGTREMVDLRPAVEAELDGRKLRLLVDTGATESIYLNPDFVKAQGLWDRFANAAEGRIHTVGDTVTARFGRFETFKLGPARFQNPIVTMADPSRSDADGAYRYSGVIGIEFLRRFNFVTDPFSRRMWLKPNAAIHDVYRYDRAGVDIDVVGAQLRVVWLAEGGPAARAGLKLGDPVTGWAGQDGYHGLLWALKGPPGSTVRIQVERDKGPEVIAVKLEELI